MNVFGVLAYIFREVLQERYDVMVRFTLNLADPVDVEPGLLLYLEE